MNFNELSNVQLRQLVKLLEFWKFELVSKSIANDKDNHALAYRNGGLQVLQQLIETCNKSFKDNEHYDPIRGKFIK